MKKIYILIITIFTISIANAQWHRTSLDSTYSVTSLVMNGSNMFAGTWGGGVYLSTNNGESWTTVNNGFSNLIVHALAINGNNIYAGTHGSGMYLSSDNGNSWNNICTIPYVLSIAMSGSNIIAGAAGVGGGVYISTNNGNNWTMENNGLTNIYVEALAIKDSNIFAGTYGNNISSGTQGGVFLSSNTEYSWTSLSIGLPSISYIKAFAINDSNIFVGIQGGGVYLSTNNGNSWVSKNTGLIDTNVMGLSISGNNIFAATANNGVYLSSNNGNSWTAINTSLKDTVIGSLSIIGNYIFVGTNTKGLWKRSLSDFMALDTITTSANPSIGGTTTGNGIYAFAQSCTVKAIPNTGYSFTNWTENIDTICTDTSYSFTVSTNRNLIANFKPIQYVITTSPNPTIGGITIGGGLFNPNQSCTIKAIPNIGYAFIDWTDNGTIVSIDTNYTFNVTTNRNLAANFFLEDGIAISCINPFINIYPNPAKEQIIITYPQLNANGQIQVYNTLGQIVYEENLIKSSSQLKLNIQNYKTGLYKVVIKDKGIIKGCVSLMKM